MKRSLQLMAPGYCTLKKTGQEKLLFNIRKLFLLIIFLITSAISVNAQNKIIDHLKSRLNTTNNDSVKVAVLDSLSMYNMFFYYKTDSTFYYCNDYINKAFLLPDKKYLILAYARLSFYYNNTGKYKETLSTALKGLQLSEQYHIQDYLSALYYDLTWAYDNLNDSREGMKSAFKGIAFLKQNKDPFFDQALHLYGIIGYTYANDSKPDSAVFYYKKMDSVASTSKELAAKVITDWHWSQYYSLYTKQYQKTDSLIADGIKGCLATGDFLLNYFYIFSANSYIDRNNIPKAIAQARIAFRLSIPLSDISGQEQAAGMLSFCYQKIKRPDSAYHYLKLQDSLKSVVQEHSYALDIQQSLFDQQLNQKEQTAAAAIQEQKHRSRTLIYVFVTALAFFLVILSIQWRNSKHKRRANEILRQQKEKVEGALIELKSAQTQLVQKEKMASLGELTAGIAHEIQNPLNFVNNFSEVSVEMMGELKEGLNKGDIEGAVAIATDIEQNLEKISHHGKRADGIVKGMLEHSRTSSGQKELTDLNKLADEYLRLAYHGLRAKDKSFNADLVTHFGPDLPKINAVQQDMGRVLLNLFNNAFYAVNEKQKIAGKDYKPEVSISTTAENNHVVIKVKDNGIGIPDAIKEKIMQPFFTTKPTGKGTGLGLSLAYDMVVKGHGGILDVTSKDGEGSEFIIKLPII